MADSAKTYAGSGTPLSDRLSVDRARSLKTARPRRQSVVGYFIAASTAAYTLPHSIAFWVAGRPRVTRLSLFAFEIGGPAFIFGQAVLGTDKLLPDESAAKAVFNVTGNSKKTTRTAIAKPDEGTEESEVFTDIEMRNRERENILAALKRAKWRISGEDGAAKLLGIKPTTLSSRMNKMGIERPV